MKYRANQPLYQSPAWRAVRLQRLRRANWRCEAPLGSGVCGRPLKTGQRPQVHHLIEPDVRPDLALELTNLRAYCHACHNSTHGKDGEIRPQVGSDGYPMDGVWGKNNS